MKMTTEYHDDGSHSFVFEDGIVFGPYGPGECGAVHPTGMTCKHHRNHGGCHGTWDDNTTEKFKYRWFDKESVKCAA